MNVLEPVIFQCRVNGAQPAICVPGIRNTVVTYAELERMLDNITHVVMALELHPGQTVGILVQDKILHIVLILALTRIGVATVTCQKNSLPPELGAEAAFVDGSYVVESVRGLMRDYADWLRGNAAIASTDPRLMRANGYEVCRVILTSGSTGE